MACSELTAPHPNLGRVLGLVHASLSAAATPNICLECKTPTTSMLNGASTSYELLQAETIQAELHSV